MAKFIDRNWKNGRTQEPRPELIKFLHDSSSEFRQISKMALIRVIKDSEMIKLTADKLHSTIPDPQNLGFYFVLKG